MVSLTLLSVVVAVMFFVKASPLKRTRVSVRVQQQPASRRQRSRLY